MPQLRLRPVGPDDDPFLLSVYASTRAEELSALDWSENEKAAFLATQFRAQSQDYARTQPDTDRLVIEVEGEPAGRLYVNRSGEALHVVDIALLPQFRGRGIGTTLVGELLAEADRTGRPVTLYVEQFNPALAWYERKGFRRVETRGIYHLLERAPGSS